MKKVQDYLKELDREKLVDAYFNFIPKGNSGLFDKCLKESEKREKMHDFIEHLCNMDMEELECEESFLLLAYPRYDDMDYHGMTSHSLICVDTLTADCKSEYDYGQCYNTSTHSEIVGFKVADTEYTERHIYELMAQVLYQALVFGFWQEGFIRADGSNMAGYWYKSTFEEFEEMISDMELDFGEEIYIDDDEIYALWRAVDTAVYDACERYNDFCYEREIEDLRDRLRKNNKAQKCSIIIKVLQSLTDEEQDILVNLFGLDGRKKTYAEMAEIKGLSEEGIREIEARALRKMRHLNRVG